jgi:uncharacterized protein YecE (DUF72 family)
MLETTSEAPEVKQNSQHSPCRYSLLRTTPASLDSRTDWLAVRTQTQTSQRLHADQSARKALHAVTRCMADDVCLPTVAQHDDQARYHRLHGGRRDRRRD